MKRLALLPFLALVLVSCDDLTQPQSNAPGTLGGVEDAKSGEAKDYLFQFGWGSFGSEEGQFQYTHSVAVYKNKYVYVTDAFNHRVQKFDLDGSFLLAWGSYGSGEGQFNNTHNIAFDKAGNVYVVDFWNHRIQKFTADGDFLGEWGDYCPVNSLDAWFWCVDADGSGPLELGDGEFDRPWGIALDKYDNVYVTDSGNNRVQVFTSDGTFLGKWGSFCDVATGVGCVNGGEGQFYYPSGIAVDKKGYVHVADGYNHRMQKFASDGSFVSVWGHYCSLYVNPGDGCVDPDGSGPLEFGDGQFHQLTGVSLDISDRLYVADGWNHRIQKFDLDGSFLAKFGTDGTGDGEFDYPWSVSVARNKRVYVGDHYNSRVQVFAAVGNDK